MNASYGETSGFAPVSGDELTSVNGGVTDGGCTQPDADAFRKFLETIFKPVTNK